MKLSSLLLLAFSLPAFLSSCSSTKDDVQKEEALVDPAPVPAPALTTSLDPSGYWKVNAQTDGCTITSIYSQGEPKIVQTPSFDCAQLPTQNPYPTDNLVMSYNDKAGTLELETNGVLRRMHVSQDGSEVPSGYATESLGQVGPTPVNPGCEFTTKAVNSVVVLNSSNASRALYGVNVMHFYSPREENTNEACMNYLGVLRNSILSGSAQPMFLAVYRLGGIDIDRLMYLENVGVLYTYEANKVYQ